MDLFEQIYQDLLDARDIQDGEQIVRTCVKGRVITWERFQCTLRSLGNEATLDDLTVPPFSVDDFYGLLHTLLNPNHWDFLAVEAEVNPGHWNHELHVLSEYCRLEAFSS